MSATAFCPKGHVSTEPDYCSECGAKMDGAAPAQASAAASPQAALCPDCGTPREHHGSVFCEVCGFNFATGAHGDIAAMAAPPLPPVTVSPQTADADPPEALRDAPAAGAAAAWSVVVSTDPALRGEGSPEPPADFAPQTIALTAPVNLIGRRNDKRGILPEIALTHDDAVSHRHALITLDPNGGAPVLRDIGSANGTRLNGTELQPLTDYPLHPGDRVELGHWSRLVMEAKH